MCATTGRRGGRSFTPSIRDSGTCCPPQSASEADTSREAAFATGLGLSILPHHCRFGADRLRYDTHLGRGTGLTYAKEMNVHVCCRTRSLFEWSTSLFLRFWGLGTRL
jgi:hypothetical protein